MTLAPKTLALLAAAASLAMLLAAWGFQFLGGLAPCPMCLWQRYPHGISAGLLTALLMGLPLAVTALAGTATMVASVGLAAYHSGVERGWWEGPQTCSGGSFDGLSASDLLDQIMAAPIVRCTDIAWSFLGLSMANWNAIASTAFLVLWVSAFVSRRRQHP